MVFHKTFNSNLNLIMQMFMPHLLYTVFMKIGKARYIMSFVYLIDLWKVLSNLFFISVHKRIIFFHDKIHIIVS